jgi:hypothetical protein
MRQVHFQMHCGTSALSPSTPQHLEARPERFSPTNVIEVMTAALTTSFADE